jgi:hypothetical protein
MTTEQVSTPAGTPDASQASETPSVNTEVAGEEQNAPESTPEPSESKSSKHKIKVDGEEIVVDIESQLDELLAAYSKVKASNKRFEEAAIERKRASEEKAKVEELKNKMKSDPWAILSELGTDPRKMAEDYLIKQLEFDSLTPEQKKALDLEAKLKEYEDREASAKKAEEERAKAEEDEKNKKEIERLSHEYAKQYEAEFLEALSATKLPRSPALVKSVAEKMHTALEQGYELSVKQAVKIVEREIMDYKKALIKDMDPDMLADFLEEDGLKKVRQRDVKNLKNPTPKKDDKAKETEDKKEDAPTSPEEWLRSIKRQHGILK